ncbi:hypothetical protein CALVIDRAFT_536796 [Calocera viscosa TUFC12733]|uniref:Septin-type G domain-containing protein n=1 Tax=Calocera viscosa (strain TUFC12733) TaxID=1330018 RepID=A0A167MMM5_CALVF|nr:hypothetical protein CALVIDRAFT_536796 [Calocera viscosa TUFC12733]
MHPRDMLAIRRLSARYHVLPLVSKADTLTDRQLQGVKRAVRRDVEGQGGWGVFDFDSPEEGQGQEPKEAELGLETANGNGNGNGHSAEAEISSSSEDEPVDGHTTPTPTPTRTTTRNRVVHIRPTSAQSHSPRLRRARSLSRARPSADSSDSDTPTMSTPAVEKRELGGLLPWGVVAPEEDDPDEEQLEAGNGKEGGRVGAANVNSGANPSAGKEKEGKDGQRWVRKYRWGEIDVLNKEHCDFWALRRAVLGVYFKVSCRFPASFLCASRFPCFHLGKRRAGEKGLGEKIGKDC